MYLEEFVSAEFAVDYSFAGDPDSTQTISSVFQGPLDDEFSVTDDDEREGLWSPCSGSDTLVVDLTATLFGPEETESFIENSEAAGLELTWRACD